MKNRNDLLDFVLNGFNKVMLDAENEKKLSRESRVTSRFYPTETSALTLGGVVVGRCRRRVYYSQKDTQTTEVTDLQSFGRFKSGNLLEGWIRDLSIQSGIYYDNSIKLRYNIPGNDVAQISGEVDMIYKIDNEIIGGEIKTSYGYDFQNTVFHSDTIPGMPKVDHLMQVCMYLYYYTRIDKSLGITRFIITYLDRGSMEWCQHIVELTEGNDVNNIYPIVNGITMCDIYNYTNPIFSVNSLNIEKTRNKLLDYEFNLGSIYSRFLELYNYHESGLLIPADYNPLYTEDQIIDYSISGKIGKTKFSDYKKGKIDYLCDKECNYCPYRTQCLTDSGVL